MSPCGNLLNEGLSESVHRDFQSPNRGVANIVSRWWKEDNQGLVGGYMSTEASFAFVQEFGFVTYENAPNPLSNAEVIRIRGYQEVLRGKDRYMYIYDSFYQWSKMVLPIIASTQACFCARTDHCQMAIIGVDKIADNLPSNVRNFSKWKIQRTVQGLANFFLYRLLLQLFLENKIK